MLHSFTGTDGAIPISGLIFDNAGSLYGTTLKGGNLSACGGYGCGTVFELTPPAAGQTAWRETVLLRFHGTDGGLRYGRLIFDAAGHLYGTASEGGVKRGGTVFELTPPAAGQTSWTETVLHNFSSGPLAGPIFDAAGNLYGTTYWGGSPSNCRGSGCGTVFEVTP